MTAEARKQVGTLSAALVCAAVLGGGAQAADRPDDRGGPIGVGAVVSVQGASVDAVPDVFERAVMRAQAAGSAPGASSGAVPDVFERAANRALAAEPVRPDDRGGPIGVGAVESVQGASVEAVPDVFERAANRALAVETIRPDDRSGPRGPGTAQQAPSSVVAGEDGFAWSELVVGAGAMLGIALLGTAIIGIRRRGGVALR